MDNRVELLVAGGGNAALCAAISAAEQGLRVLVCEAAEKDAGAKPPLALQAESRS